MQKWNGQLLRKFDDTTEGNASVGTAVVVRNKSDNTIAVIYDVDDTNSIQKNNPFVTDDFGRYSFFAPDGKYIIEFGDGSDSIEISLVDNLDPSSISHSELGGLNDEGGHDPLYSRVFLSEASMISYLGHSLGNTYKVLDEGELMFFSVVDTTTPIDLGGGLWAELIVINKDNLPSETSTFNKIPSYDNDTGSALTLGSDEDVGQLSRVDFCIPDITVNDGLVITSQTIAATFNSNDFRVSAKISGGGAKVQVYTQRLIAFTSSPQTITTGNIATPISNFLPNTQYFLRVKKGVGQGKIGIEYQYQNPKTKGRSRAKVWLIDLDDGLAVRDYDLLLPQCSNRTMAGQYKIGDSKALNWVVVAESGSVEIVGHGVNPNSDPSATEIYQETILNTELPISREWRSPVLNGKDINLIRVYLTQLTAGTTVTGSEIKAEVML